jgi:hypothetical protein
MRELDVLPLDSFDEFDEDEGVRASTGGRRCGGLRAMFRQRIRRSMTGSNSMRPGWTTSLVRLSIPGSMIQTAARRTTLP